MPSRAASSTLATCLVSVGVEGPGTAGIIGGEAALGGGVSEDGRVTGREVTGGVGGAGGDGSCGLGRVANDSNECARAILQPEAVNDTVGPGVLGGAAATWMLSRVLSRPLSKSGGAWRPLCLSLLRPNDQLRNRGMVISACLVAVRCCNRDGLRVHLQQVPPRRCRGRLAC
eukprot:2593201-Prymnesium_polylepis.1